MTRIMNSGQLVEEYCRIYGKQGLYKSFRSIESSRSLKTYIMNTPKKRKKTMAVDYTKLATPESTSPTDPREQSPYEYH